MSWTIGNTAGTSGATGDPNIHNPAGVAQNDILVAVIYSDGSSSAPTVPTGWTLLDSRQDGGQWSASCYRVAGASEPASWAFTPGTGSTFDGSGVISIRGEDTSTPVDVHNAAGVANGTSVTNASQTATYSGDLAVLLLVDGNNGAATWPTGFTQQLDPTFVNGEGIATNTIASSGATGSFTTGIASAQDSTVFAVLLKAAGGSANHGSATILGMGGILDGFAGQGSLGRGLSGGAGLGQGLSGSGTVGGGLAGVGNVTAAPSASTPATLTGSGALGRGVAGQGNINASSAATPSLTFTGMGALMANLFGGQGIIPAVVGGLGGAVHGVATLLGIGSLGGGLSGSGAVQPSSAATPSITFQGSGGFLAGLFAGIGKLLATGTVNTGGAINGAATLLGMGAMLLGFGGHGDIQANSAATPTQTLEGSGSLGGGLAGSGSVSPHSAATPGITFEGTGAVGTGQAGSGNLNSSGAATPGITFQGMGALLTGLFGGQGILPSPSGHIAGQIVGVFRWLYTTAYNVLQQGFAPRNVLGLGFGHGYDVLQQTFAPRQVQTMVFGGTVYFTMSFVREPDVMVTPNSTIQVVMTAKKFDGTLMSNLTTVTCTVTFPDQTTQSFSLGSGITNTGSGTYTLQYVTKMAGENIEDWVGTDASGNTAEFHNITPVSF